jgi:hypothetical protein
MYPLFGQAKNMSGILVHSRGRFGYNCQAELLYLGQRRNMEAATRQPEGEYGKNTSNVSMDHIVNQKSHRP